jgi:hypothetical protein
LLEFSSVKKKKKKKEKTKKENARVQCKKKGKSDKKGKRKINFTDGQAWTKSRRLAAKFTLAQKSPRMQ